MKKLIILYSFLLIVFLCSCKSSIEYLSISDYDWYIESVSGDGLYKSVHYNEADLLDGLCPKCYEIYYKELIKDGLCLSYAELLSRYNKIKNM